MTEWRNRIIGHGEMPADQFVANPHNPRKHPQKQRDAVAGSLSALGWIAPVIVNKRTGYVIDGHERIWQALGQDNADVPYVEVDLSEDEEALALATFDWITYLAEYDRDILNDLLQEVNTDDASLQAVIAELAESVGLYGDDIPPGDPGAQLDRAEELREKWQVERGQLWEIGRHRLLCGDSYSQDDIYRLIGDYDVGMTHTDPPYGINIVKPPANGSTAAIGGAKAFGSSASSERRGMAAVAFRNSGHDVGRIGPGNIIQSNLYPVIEGDDRPFDPTAFLDLAPITVLWGANYFADRLPISSCWICWDKREDITRNNFADCELAWCSEDKPARVFHHLWNGLHKGSQWGERRVHPTEKPVALFAEVGKMFCDGGIWLDLFAGSGAQIVAAEQTGAMCLALEYEPLYVACILERMAGMGLEPNLTE